MPNSTNEFNGTSVSSATTNISNNNRTDVYNNDNMPNNTNEHNNTNDVNGTSVSNATTNTSNNNGTNSDNSTTSSDPNNSIENINNNNSTKANNSTTSNDPTESTKKSKVHKNKNKDKKPKNKTKKQKKDKSKDVATKNLSQNKINAKVTSNKSSTNALDSKDNVTNTPEAGQRSLGWLILTGSIIYVLLLLLVILSL